jgi:hypothetical protein
MQAAYLKMQTAVFSFRRGTLLATIFSLTFFLAEPILAATRPVRPSSFPLPRAGVGGVATGWGYNTFGAASIPAAAQSNLVAIAAGGYHSLGLLANGSVMGWGLNATAQNTIPAAASNVVAIAEGNGHSMALRADGIVICWGDASDGRTIVPPGLNNVVAIAGGGGHSLALKSNGTVVGWGWNPFGQATVPLGLTNVVAIAAGFTHSVALKEDGTVVTWGSNARGQLNVPAGLNNVAAIAAGGFEDGGNITMALKDNGTLVVWGDASKGQLQIPDGLNNVIAMTSGYYNAAAVDASGRVFVWGVTSNGEGAVPPNFTATTLAAGNYHLLALRLPDFITGPRLALATPQVVNGFVVGLNLVDAGGGYTNAPTVSIVGGNGSGATATATVANGVITGFTITNPGSGYTGTPTVKIEAPVFDDMLTAKLSKIKVTLNLLVNATYLLESSFDFAQWTPVGTPFKATSSTLEQEFPIDEKGRFFRLIRVE